MVRVPLDYAKPDGRQIKIAVTRLKAADQEHRRGVVLVNPGGPGSEGDVFPAELAPTKLAPVNKNYDLIGIDTRGYDGGGLSFMIIAINCDDLPDQRDFESGYQRAQELATL